MELGLAHSEAEGAAGGARLAFQDFSNVKMVDKSSPLLAVACATGQQLPEAVLAGSRLAGPSFSFDFIKVTLKDVTISRFEGGSGEPRSIPTDSSLFAFPPHLDPLTRLKSK